MDIFHSAVNGNFQIMHSAIPLFACASMWKGTFASSQFERFVQISRAVIFSLLLIVMPRICPATFVFNFIGIEVFQVKQIMMHVAQSKKRNLMKFVLLNRIFGSNNRKHLCRCVSKCQNNNNEPRYIFFF